MELEELLFEEEFKRFDDPSELARTVRDLKLALGKHVSTIVAYGSWVYGTQKPDSMKDFLVIVDDPEEFYRQNSWLVQTPFVKPVRSVRAQTALNRLSPNFYHLNGGVKIGVISENQFWNEGNSFSKYVGFRLTKPLAIFPTSESMPKYEIAGLISDLREENLYRTLSLLPGQFTFEDFALKYVGVSYEADVRFEDPNKIRSTYEANKSQFDKMFKLFLEEMQQLDYVSTHDGVNYTNGTPQLDRYYEKIKMALRKPMFLSQNLLNFFTAANPIGYAVRKIKLGRGK